MSIAHRGLTCDRPYARRQDRTTARARRLGPPELVELLRDNRIDQSSHLYGEALRCYGEMRHRGQMELYRQSFEEEFARRMRRERARHFHRRTLEVVLRALVNLAWIAAVYHLIIQMMR